MTNRPRAEEQFHWRSHEGHTLAYQGPPRETPVLTVELTYKWYNVWLVMPNGKIIRFFSEDWPLKDYVGTEWSDHCPHPEWWDALIVQHNFWEDDCSRQMVLGRYAEEVLDAMFDGKLQLGRKA